MAVNVNGIPSPEPGSAVVTQEMGPQVSSYQRTIRVIIIEKSGVRNPKIGQNN